MVTGDMQMSFKKRNNRNMIKGKVHSQMKQEEKLNDKKMKR